MARMTGLDIATSCVRAAELSYGKSGFSLERFAQMPLPAGAVANGEVVDVEAVATAIKHLWKAGKFRGRSVSIGAASQRVVVRMLEIPFVPAQDRRKSLPIVVADQVPMPVDEAVLDFVPLEIIEDAENGNRSRGLLVAAAEDSVLQAIAAVERAGLRVADVDLTAFALVRALVRADPLGMAAEAEAVIDVGASTTNLVVHENGIPQFVRILLMGGQDITDRLMADLGVNLPTAESLKREADADSLDLANSEPDSPGRIMAEVVLQLVDELRGSLDYYVATSGSVRLSRVVLTGGGSLYPGFAERLEAAVNLPVTRGSCLMDLGPGRSGLTDDHLHFADPLAAAAVGLAVRSGS